ncbi:ataxin 2 L homeolog isoform X7 [Xenopus laevis]|uniref:Ataxin 2 L homeolog isoform X7 n=1 Tax=Xenopus laevis TaxID=8355 RepID=A0A8J0ULP7_XENLA|nr:ataxin 2 L homeolog isoform X7 [Xenopus laevis]
MSMKQQAGNNRKPGGGSVPAAGGGAGGGRQNMGRGRISGKGPPQSISFDGIYANMRLVHILTSVVGSKCEVLVKNGNVYEGVFKTYSPKCDLVLDAAHKKTTESIVGPKREDIVDSILFKSSDFVMVQFKDMDVNYARRDGFTDSGIACRLNGEHKEKDLEPWDGGESLISSTPTGKDELESLENEVSNGWDPNEMFRYNEENYGVVSTYDSSLSSYTVPLERDNSEEYLKREARAAQIAEEIESSSQYKARVALENDERSEEEKYTAVQRALNDQERHSLNTRENKYIPPVQRNKDAMLWTTHSGRQNSARIGQSGSGPIPSRTGSHSSDYNPNAGADQRVVNGGPPRMSPKAQRHPRTHRVSNGRGTMCGGLEFVSRNEAGEASVQPVARNSSSGGTWSSVVSGVQRLSPKTHRPRSPRLGSHAPGSNATSPQPGTVPPESVSMPVPAASPTPASPASDRAVTPSCEAKDTRLQDQRQNSPAGCRENSKYSESSKTENKAVSPMASEQRKQLDDLKKFKNDFRLQPSSSPDALDQLPVKSRDSVEKPRDPLKEKMDSNAKESTSESSSNATTSNNSSKPCSPSISPSIISSSSEHKRGPEVTSQGVQTSGPSKQDRDDKDDMKENAAEQVRKSTLNPNAKEFNPRSYAQPKPSTTPTSPRPQAQASPSMVGHQQPTPVYTQPVCFAPNMMYPVPVSPGVQPLYSIPMTTMSMNQAKTYRAGKVPNMAQQRQDQHHQNTMMHQVSAAGPPIVATPPAYSAQYVTYSPQQFPNQQLMQHVQHYQSQHPHVYSSVIQGNTRMMAPPSHAQAGLVSSSAAQYATPEQTHTMYVSASSLAQQYAHANAALHQHQHPPHPQPSATPTGQQQSQHGGSHPAPSPVQHHQHQAQQALHLANQQQQSAIYHAGLAPTPPAMTPGSNAQSPQSNFPTQQTVFTIHPSHVQQAYTNSPHMAHVQQAHVQSGMVPSHPTAHPMMLMTAQPPGGAQSALQPIPVSTAHFSYMTHPPVQAHHQQ